MTLFVWLLLGSPLILGIVLATAGRTFPQNLREWISAGCVGVVLCCLLVSFSFSGTKIILFSEWWPGSGQLYLKLDLFGLVPAFWTTASGLVFYVLSIREQGDTRTNVRDGLFLIVLTAANLAFLAGNFALRYAALEVAALGIAVVQLLETGKRTGESLYLGLRLGDAGLLMAILMLYASGGSLEISEALSLATGQTNATLNWAAIGFLVAVAVKTGIWPFTFWQNAAAVSRSLLSKAWFLATVMPNLGVYLLYRTAPLMAQFESIRNLISMVAASSALIAMLMMWNKKDLHQHAWLLFAFQGSITLFAAAYRLDVLVWGSVLVVSLLRFVFFLRLRIKPDPVPKAGLIGIVGGMILCAFTFVVLWMIKESGVNTIDFWFAEASLALLVLWIAAQSEKIPNQIRQVRNLLPDKLFKWQDRGFVIAVMFFFIAVPLLFMPPNANKIILAPASFTKFSLFSSPITSPSFWIVLISMWVVSKVKWYEKMERPLSKGWQAWLVWVRRIPKGIYNYLERFLYQEGLNQAEHKVFEFSRYLYKIFEMVAFEKGLSLLTRMIFNVSRYLYKIFERATFDAGLQFLVERALAFSTMLRRMHTGRLRINLIWVAGTLVVVVLFALVGTGG